MSMLTDIHSHILPGLDDGADSMAFALQMADMAAESGVKDMIVTPHSYMYKGREDELSDKIDETIDLLQYQIDLENIPLRLYKGMEILADSDTPELLRKGRLLTLNSSRYALVEFDFSAQANYIKKIISDIHKAGFVPIIAHPERYDCVYRDPNLIYDLASEGTLVQVNKTSLLGGFGKRIWQIANGLISHGLVAVVASDAHSPHSRTTSMLKLQSYLNIEFSQQLCERLISENPARILNDEDIFPEDMYRF